MAGTLTGIGTGPGEAELMTLKAVEKIRGSDIVLLPNKDKQKCIAYTVAKKLLDELEVAGQGKKCVFLDFPMVQDAAAKKQAQQKAADEICRYLDDGLNVAFLTIGDPAVYSTLMHVFAFVEEKGYKTEIISGVTSFCAVAARLGITLAEADEEIHIIPGSSAPEEAFALKGTLIFMKTGSRLEALKHYILKQKNENHLEFDFYAVSNCGLADETVCRDVELFDADSGYMTVIIIKNRKQSEEKHYKFFQNRSCEMFPCHKGEDAPDAENFNCLFCYCPLYAMGRNCGGNFYYTEKGVKSCINCSFPHKKENYELIKEKLKSFYRGKPQD